MNLITETRRQKKATRALSAFLAGVLLLSPGGLIAGQLPNGYKVAHGKVNVSVSFRFAVAFVLASRMLSITRAMS